MIIYIKKENGFLRSVFNLDDSEIEDIQQSKNNRLERVCVF